MDGAWIETPSIRAMRQRERTPARENSKCEIRIQIENHGGQSEMGGVGSRHASGLGDEGWRRACNSKKGKMQGGGSGGRTAGAYNLGEKWEKIELGLYLAPETVRGHQLAQRHLRECNCRLGGQGDSTRGGL